MITNNSEKRLVQKLHMQMQIMRAQDATQLTADEMVVSISRHEYRDLCKYALKGLQPKEGE